MFTTGRSLVIFRLPLTMDPNRGSRLRLEVRLALMTSEGQNSPTG